MATQRSMKSFLSSVKGSPREKFTFFWQKDSPFSQHHACTFNVDGLSYNCAEQYMMHQKAVVFNDEESAKKIMQTDKPQTQKMLGRKVKNFDPVVWNSKCEAVVKKANLAKFRQNPFLKKALFKTAGTTMVEASPRDRKWGIGLSAASIKALDRSTWRGTNLLGEIITEVREELFAEEDVDFSSDKFDEEDTKEGIILTSTDSLKMIPSEDNLLIKSEVCRKSEDVSDLPKLSTGLSSLSSLSAEVKNESSLNHPIKSSSPQKRKPKRELEKNVKKRPI